MNPPPSLVKESSLMADESQTTVRRGLSYAEHASPHGPGSGERVSACLPAGNPSETKNPRKDTRTGKRHTEERTAEIEDARPRFPSALDLGERVSTYQQQRIIIIKRTNTLGFI